MIDSWKTIGRQAHRRGLPGVCVFARFSALWASSDNRKIPFSGCPGSQRLAFVEKRHLKRTQENSTIQKDPNVQQQD